jgi:trehalose synthase
VGSPAAIWQEAPVPAGAPYVTQVSRWDRLKDPIGVMQGFATAGLDGVHLVLGGPEVAAVADDPEGGEVLGEVRAAAERLPAGVRRRVHLACLPMRDRDENAAMVNAIQREATVVVQKSIAEGFGLTVAEAMWKSRPVVASAVGGIRDQIVDGESGLLVGDPRDLEAYAACLTRLVADAPLRDRLGAAARRRVIERFLGMRHLLQNLELVAAVVSPRERRV